MGELVLKLIADTSRAAIEVQHGLECLKVATYSGDLPTIPERPTEESLTECAAEFFKTIDCLHVSMDEFYAAHCNHMNNHVCAWVDAWTQCWESLS